MALETVEFFVECMMRKTRSTYRGSHCWL